MQQSKSEVSGANSSKSKQSQKYGGKKSEVDETLFGANGNTHKSQTQNPEVQRLIQSVRQGDYTNPELAVISETEVQRMKNNAIVTTKEEQLNQKRIIEEQKEKQLAAAKAKKLRMFQMEEEKKNKVPLSEFQQEEKVAKDSLLAKATEVLNEQIDDVKQMNKMVMYAKCVTIRDKQLEEKQIIHEEMKMQEKRKDLMMEIERLKSIKYYEEEDNMKRGEQKKGRKIIIDQIKERELLRLKDKEEQEKEGQVMLKRMQEQQREAALNVQKRKVNQKRLQDEILESNDRAGIVKQKRIQEENDEQQKILNYNLEKAQKDAEYQAEQKRLKDEKEREVQRLREMQEKANDRQAELDALRAKRAQEQNERAAREKEKREAQQKMKLNAELQEARKFQQIDKSDRIQEQAKQERDEFQRIIYKQKHERETEIKLQQEKESMIKKHSEELRKQIALNEEQKKQAERDVLEEGKKIRDNLQGQKRLIEKIKDKKLETLKDYGIQEKYTAELSKKKVVI